jgi:tight adherence protein C
MNGNLINANFFLILLGAIAVILGAVVVIYGISSRSKKGSKISDRMDQFVAPGVPIASNSTKGQIIPREISGSLLSRTIISWFKQILQFLGKFTPVKMVFDLEHKLMVAGNPYNMHARDYYALRFLLLLAGFIPAYLFNRDLKNINLTSFLLGVTIIFTCYFLPGIWLNGRMRSRQDEIRRGLPDALDMLSVCASAGLGFDQSLQKISNYWDTELGRELKRVTQEMEMGVSRSTALKDMSKRLDVDDLSQFIAIIIQAEMIGMSYADVLQSQALQMRVLRQFRAREIANKLPAKMIIPLATCIFPAILAVILGPAIPTLMDIF